MPRTDNRSGFELRKLTDLCLKRWWVVAGAAVAGFLIALLIAACLITPLYRATATFYVAAGEGDTSLSSSELTAAVLLADTCIGILDGDAVLEQIALQAGEELSPQEVRSCVEAQRVGETPLFRVSVLHRDPETAARIAGAAAEVLPDTAERLVSGCSLQVADPARIPAAPDSPDVPRACALGAFLGLALSVLGLAFYLLYADCGVKEQAYER